MSNPEKPRSDPKRLSAEQQKLQASASRETKRPSDSQPIALGQFANLPAKFGRYEVERLLGRGAMGGVYLARDTELDRLVALKIPKVGASGSQRLLLRLKTEAKAAAKLDHPSLCKVYDAGEIDGQCFIAMQYIEGETLKSQLEAQGKTVAEAVSLIVQLAEGLSEAHKLGIIHRDLKPENIMINRRGTPVIMDFGLAKLSTVSSNAGATQAGTILGTPAYMSPEQASGNTREIDQRSDIYALGTIFFELLTGKWPFTGSAMQILGQKSLLDPASPLTLNPNLPPQVAAICHKMIARNSVERYQTLSEVIKELQQTDSVVTLPVSASADQSPAEIPAPFPDFAVSGQSDERIESRRKVKATKTPRQPRVTRATPLQRLLAWWNGTTPTVKWTAGSGAGALLIALGVILFFPTRYGVVQIDIEDSSLSVRFDGETITVDNDRHPIRVTPSAKHTLEILQNGIVLESATQEVTLKRGEKRLVTLKLMDQDVVIDGKRFLKPKTVAAAPAKAGWHGWPADAPPPAIAPFNSEQAKAHQETWAKYLNINAEYTNSIGMMFRLIPPGEFIMGSPIADIEATLPVVHGHDHFPDCVRSEAPQHRVVLTVPFYLAIHEVTQQEFEAVLQKKPSLFVTPGEESNTLRHPVERVDWNDAAEFCEVLSKRETLKPCYQRSGDSVTMLTGMGYRLPTEAEWEFACRAGTTTRFWNGDREEDLKPTSWYGHNSGPRTHPVGKLAANAFGLHDTLGNVWEWCQDWWEPSYYAELATNPVLNPQGPPASTTSRRILRGSSWLGKPITMRCAIRLAHQPTGIAENIGFRVALSIDAVRQQINGQSPQNASRAHPPQLGPNQPVADSAVVSGKVAGEAKELLKVVKTAWHGWPADAPLPAIAPFNSEQAKVHQEAWARYLKFDVQYVNSIGMKFVLIPPGEFMMGSTPKEIAEMLPTLPGRPDWQADVGSEGPRHRVILRQPFYLGMHEVTQHQYEAIIGSNPSDFSKLGAYKHLVGDLDTSDFPVEEVTWSDAATFFAKLSVREHLKPMFAIEKGVVTPVKGTGYRFATEAEWEFAARAGTTTRFWSGNSFEDTRKIGWLELNSEGRTHRIGELQDNPFGLFDIHGNLLEWVHDEWDERYYHQFENSPAIDPIGPATEIAHHVLRGGRYANPIHESYVSRRHHAHRDFHGGNIGIRAVLPIESVRQPTVAGPKD